jgi:hypothetical protein
VGTVAAESDSADMNTTIVSVFSNDAGWTLNLRSDEGRAFAWQLSFADMVELMAAACASHVYFAGARCRIDADATIAIAPPLPAG